MDEQLRVPPGTKEFVRTTPRRPPRNLSPRWGLKTEIVPRKPSVETLGYYRRPLWGQQIWRDPSVRLGVCRGFSLFEDLPEFVDAVLHEPGALSEGLEG